MSQPIARPSNTPPTEVNRNWSPALSGENVPRTAAATAIWYDTSDVASFTSPSPSRIVTSARGAPSGRITAIAATGSGGATMAPSAKAAGQVNSGANPCATRATAPMVSTTTRVA